MQFYAYTFCKATARNTEEMEVTVKCFYKNIVNVSIAFICQAFVMTVTSFRIV